jgi:hypothetical protein
MSATDIFKDTKTWTAYRATIQVRGVLVGGVPLDPSTIKAWLKARLEMGDRELVELAEQTAAELGDQLGDRPSADQILEAVAARHTTGNGFKKVNGVLVYEGRCLKSGIKEAANVAYPGVQWPGKPAGMKKGLMRFLAERVFVVDDFISLAVAEPTRTEERIKHVMTPQGPRSAINVVDVVEKPQLEATIRVLDDCLSQEVWGRIWLALEEIGLGADRARSDGRFDLIDWKKLRK